MRQQPGVISAIVLSFTVLSGGVFAADDDLRGDWTFDAVGQSASTPILQAAQEAIDADTVVWRSHVAGRRNTTPVVSPTADCSGKGNNATVRGTPTSVPGVSGNAVRLGGQDWLEATDNESLQITGPVTIEAWFFPDNNEKGVLVSKDFKYAGPSWCQMYLWGAPRLLQVAVNDDAGPTVMGKTVIEPGHWYHAAMTYDGKSRTRLYINGKLECEDNKRYRGPIPVGKESLKIGRRADGHSFCGVIDEVRILAREATPEEIAARFKAIHPTVAPVPPGQQVDATIEIQNERRVLESVVKKSSKYEFKASWQRIELQLPPPADNLARKAAGTKFSASSTSGELLLGEDEKPGSLPLLKIRWRDGTQAQYPDWVEVRFSQPREIDTIVLRTFGEHVHGRNKEGIRSYQLQYAQPDGNWITLAAVKNNVKQWLVHRFPATKTQAVRLVVNEANTYDEIGWRNETCRNGSSNGDFSRLQDFLVFRLGDKPTFKVHDESRVVSVEKGVAGRVAIFKDDVPMPEGVPSSPERLAKLLRGAGYGVTFLDADLLMYSSILSKDNFDLFIQPYGCSFPLGTTLYDYLESGGHLLTLGGRAFTNAIVRTKDGKLAASGYDPGLIMSPHKMVREDWFAQLREMLGIFAGPYQTFKHVSTARPTAGQFIVAPELRIEGELQGYPSTGMMGQVLTDEEETQYAKEGKEWNHYAKIRPDLWEAFRTGHGYRSPEFHIFNKACSRWIPLFETFDAYDRPRGSLGAVMLNHDGRYRGSNWAFFGATDRDLFAADNPRMGKMLLNIVAHQMCGVYLHGFTPGYYCYRQGEEVTARVFAANYGRQNRVGNVTFSVLPEHGEEAIFTYRQEVHIPRGSSVPIDVSWKPGSFPLDFYRVRCDLELEGKPIDRIENGIVIWNERSMQGDDAFHVNYHDNYFHDGQRPLYINGARNDGLHRIGQVGENPLAWSREYRMMQEHGLSIISPVWLDVYLPGFGWGEELPEVVPEKILRQMDAQVQLCQRNKLIYAPCLFFAQRTVAAKKRRDLSRRVCTLLGERYRNVPGIAFYLWDDGSYFDDGMRDAYSRFAEECTKGFSQNSSQRKYVILSELKDSELIATRRLFKNHTVANHNGSGPWDVLSSRMADQRAAGRSQSCGEFYWWADHGEEVGHRFYLSYSQGFFALGYAGSINWKWKDNDHAVFSWGVVNPCDRTAKDCLYTWRNASWFLRSFRLKYVQPQLMFVLPEFYWNKSDKTSRVVRDVEEGLFAEMSKLIRLGYGDFGVIDDWDLDKLAPHTKALIYPLAFCPNDETYNRLRSFVERGGHVYLTGDISYEPSEKHRLPQRLMELAGVEPSEALSDTRPPAKLADAGNDVNIKPVATIPGWKDPYAGRVSLRLKAKDAEVIATDANGAPVIVRRKLGKGNVLFNADVTSAAPAMLTQWFLEQSAVDRQHAEPDDPANVRVYRLPTEDGEVISLATRPKEQKKIGDGRFYKEIPHAPCDYTISTSPVPVTLTIGRSPMVVAGFDCKGRLTACETDGRVKLGDKTIVSSTASLMIFTLDDRPIEESEAVVVLPQPFAPADIRIAVSSQLNYLELGDLKDGAWCTHKQNTLTNGPAGATFSLNQVQSLGVVLLTRRTDRDRYVQKLTNYLLGHLE